MCTLSLLAVLAFVSLFASAFYLPSAAPTNYIEGQQVDVLVNALTPLIMETDDPKLKSLINYDHYNPKFQFCQPKDGIKAQPESLGSILFGDRLFNSPYDIQMLKDNHTCKTLCVSDVLADDAKFINNGIWEDYALNWLVDGLPTAEMKVGSWNQDIFFDMGFNLGDNEGIHRSQPALNNHYDIVFRYHRPTPDTYRLVGVLVWPSSIAGSVTDGPNCDVDNAEPLLLNKDRDQRESDTPWAMVRMILLWTVSRDISRYNAIDVSEDVHEDWGWKLVHGEVFRTPTHPMVLSIMVGNGPAPLIAHNLQSSSNLLDVLRDWFSVAECYPTQWSLLKSSIQVSMQKLHYWCIAAVNRSVNYRGFTPDFCHPPIRMYLQCQTCSGYVCHQELGFMIQDAMDHAAAAESILGTERLEDILQPLTSLSELESALQELLPTYHFPITPDLSTAPNSPFLPTSPLLSSPVPSSPAPSFPAPSSPVLSNALGLQKEKRKRKREENTLVEELTKAESSPTKQHHKGYNNDAAHERKKAAKKAALSAPSTSTTPSLPPPPAPAPAPPIPLLSHSNNSHVHQYNNKKKQERQDACGFETTDRVRNIVGDHVEPIPPYNAPVSISSDLEMQLGGYCIKTQALSSKMAKLKRIMQWKPKSMDTISLNEVVLDMLLNDPTEPYQLITWDGKSPKVLVDDDDTVISALAGQPQDNNTYREECDKLFTLLESQAQSAGFLKKNPDHR
ncbi:hypothetical protein NP233_g12330 [Leucocoprinus birnbaumii]|uniref:Transmembrane 9 superfamily member n=1 Tax=Leucocoprinus birnbaumii TaxID=56174 RepID=A0AAD5VFW3_9AGAR|nr:hypothetical protein NP233_g12330 [Leucocoprinus birnbaumii]